MTKVVLDTDVLIDLLRGREQARAFLKEVTAHSIPCCSAVSVAEIYAGLRAHEEALTAELLRSLVVIPVGQEIAEVAGRFKGRAKHRGLELADCLIAATVYIEGATLATGNVKDYPMPEITVLRAR